MGKSNILIGCVAVYLAFINIADVQARPNTHLRKNAAAACDFIYARYYEAISYAQDVLDSAKTVSQAGSRDMRILENNGAKIHFSTNGHKIMLLSLELSAEHLENNGVSAGLPERLGLAAIGSNKQYKVGCENDEAILDIGNGKISKVFIQPRFMD